jgi:hypothetical protein
VSQTTSPNLKIPPSIWKGSDRRKRTLIAFHIMLNDKPISKSELWEALKPTGEIKTRQTLHVYTRAMVNDGDLQATKIQGSQRKRYTLSDKFFEHDEEIARELQEVNEFDRQLLGIETRLTAVHYARYLGTHERQRLISNALAQAYALYIPLQLKVLREATFRGGTYGGALLRLAQTKITDRFLSFTWNLRSNIPNVALFGIANHDVWGWNQLRGALPKIVISMWRKQKQREKQFLADQREFRQHSRVLSKSEMSFLHEVAEADRASRRLEEQLNELRLRLGRDPTAREFIGKLVDEKFKNPEGMLRTLLAEKWLTEKRNGLLSQGQRLKWQRAFSKKLVRALYL